MNMQPKTLKGVGKEDYDFANDILFFKVNGREYEKSIELDGMVVDIDKEDFIVGLQIFDASKFLDMPKAALMKINNWQFNASLNDKRLEVRLAFQLVVRNKIIEKNPIIVENLQVSMPSSEVMVAVSN